MSTQYNINKKYMVIISDELSLHLYHHQCLSSHIHPTQVVARRDPVVLLETSLKQLKSDYFDLPPGYSKTKNWTN